MIVISQSGETADSIEVLEWMKTKGVRVISLVNAQNSTIADLADLSCQLAVGPEIGVASTKALTAQFAWGAALSKLWSGENPEMVLKEVAAYVTKLTAWLEDDEIAKKVATLATLLMDKQQLFVLGRGQLLQAALENALKLKEIAYLHAEGMSGGELKHGTLALIEPGSWCVVLVAQDEEKAAQLNAIAEIQARGGKVIGVAATLEPQFDEWIPTVDVPHLADISAIVPVQLLAYLIALLKGNNPDKPRNLAKSVTVK